MSHSGQQRTCPPPPVSTAVRGSRRGYAAASRPQFRNAREQPQYRGIGRHRLDQVFGYIPGAQGGSSRGPSGAVQTFVARPISTLEQRPGGRRETIPAVTSFATARFLKCPMPRANGTAAESAPRTGAARQTPGFFSRRRRTTPVETAVTKTGTHFRRRWMPIGSRAARRRRRRGRVRQPGDGFYHAADISAADPGRGGERWQKDGADTGREPADNGGLSLCRWPRCRSTSCRGGSASRLPRRLARGAPARAGPSIYTHLITPLGRTMAVANRRSEPGSYGNDFWRRSQS